MAWGTTRPTPTSTWRGSARSGLATRPRRSHRCSASGRRRSRRRPPTFRTSSGAPGRGRRAGMAPRGGRRQPAEGVRRRPARDRRARGGGRGASPLAPGLEGVVPQAPAVLDVSRPPELMDGGIVRAAAGSSCVATPTAPAVAVVHRPRYDDWTFRRASSRRGRATSRPRSARCSRRRGSRARSGGGSDRRYRTARTVRRSSATGS